MGRDGWIGVGLLIFGGWLYSNLGKIPANPLVPIGPAFYPRFLLLVILLLSLVLVIQDVLAHRKEQRQQRSASENWLKKYKPTLLTFFVFGLYVLLLPKLGFVFSTALFVTALQWLLGAPLLRRLPGSLLIGIATSGVTYLVFEKYLYVLLPRGTWLP
jgi:sterol desaturase/sphingolipid hydroxylase (fatty acid hydroxylase superfamily)